MPVTCLPSLNHWGNIKMKKHVMAALAVCVAASAPAAAINLVQNGDFEINGGVGQPGYTTTLANWTLGATVDGAPHPFGFVVDPNAHVTGWPSVFSPPNIKVWGPGTGVNNGFTGSSNGGFFFGGDGDYAAAPLMQTINGLTVGQQYQLSFEWAGAQFTDETGDFTIGFDVTFGSDTVSTGAASVPSRGFQPWQTFTSTFTATSSSQVLSFLARGGPSGLPPFGLLDGVSLTTVVPPPGPGPGPVPEPATWAMLIMGFGLVGAMARRRALRTA
jgi:hypothetical protein